MGKTVLYAVDTGTLERHGAEQIKKDIQILRRILEAKREGKRLERRSRDELYRNVWIFSGEIRLYRGRFVRHVIRIVMEK